MLSVDRTEGGFAVAINENGARTEIPLNKINGNVREGDCLRFDGVQYIIDRTATDERRHKLLRLQNSLWE